MSKGNPYSVEYVMARDKCTIDEAQHTVNELKQRTKYKGRSKPPASPYDPNYIMKRENISYEDAVVFIDQWKENKSTSLSNFIKKHGDEIGREKYRKWYNSSLKKGTEGNGPARSRFSKHYYIKHGSTEEEAIVLAKQYNKENSPLHVEYYMKRGYTLLYANSEIRKIHDKKLGIDGYYEKLIADGFTDDEAKQAVKSARGHCSIENLGAELFAERMAKTRSTFESKGLWLPLDDLSDYQAYCKLVWQYTNKHELASMHGYNMRGRAGITGATHLDHKYSISAGYINGVPPEVIGSYCNLEFIPWEENVKKQNKCTITREYIEGQYENNKN